MFVCLAIMNDDPKNSGIRQVEISSFDLRYEHCRLKSNVTEMVLLFSLLDHGIRDPLQGVETKGGCRITAEDSQIDAQAETRLNAIVRAIAGDERQS